MRALCGRAPVLFEDGGQLRDYVSIHDVVRANILALDDSRAEYEAFNVGGDRWVSVRELARIVLDAAGVDIEPEVPGLFRVGDSRHIISDVSKLKHLMAAPRFTERHRERVRRPGCRGTRPARTRSRTLSVK